MDLPKFGEEKNLAKQLQSMHGNGFKKQFPHLPPPYVSMRGEFESDYQRGIFLEKKARINKKIRENFAWAASQPFIGRIAESRLLIG